MPDRDPMMDLGISANCSANRSIKLLNENSFVFRVPLRALVQRHQRHRLEVSSLPYRWTWEGHLCSTILSVRKIAGEFWVGAYSRADIVPYTVSLPMRKRVLVKLYDRNGAVVAISEMMTFNPKTCELSKWFSSSAENEVIHTSAVPGLGRHFFRVVEVLDPKSEILDDQGCVSVSVCVR